MEPRKVPQILEFALRSLGIIFVPLFSCIVLAATIQQSPKILSNAANHEVRFKGGKTFRHHAHRGKLEENNLYFFMTMENGLAIHDLEQRRIYFANQISTEWKNLEGLLWKAKQAEKRVMSSSSGVMGIFNKFTGNKVLACEQKLLDESVDQIWERKKFIQQLDEERIKCINARPQQGTQMEDNLGVRHAREEFRIR